MQIIIRSIDIFYRLLWKKWKLQRHLQKLLKIATAQELFGILEDSISSILSHLLIGYN